MNAPLPQVVEFDHAYDVRIERNGNATRVVASLKHKAYASIYSKFHHLPFCAYDQALGHWSFWSFPKATNDDEAELRGKFFWEEFVRYARGTQRKRREDAIRMLVHHTLPAMRAKGGIEAHVFLVQLVIAAIDSLRVGVE